MGTVAVIFDVQRFSTHDGPGIRTTVFFKGCPLRCAWCQNPESLRREPELAFDATRCNEVGECSTACEKGAISSGRTERSASDRAPSAGGGVHLDRARCDTCGDCVGACPHGAFEVIGRTVDVDELLAEVERDTPFYDVSGGGVTLSGGEPTLQSAFVAEFLERCSERGLSVGLQTCGAFAWESIEPLLSKLQFVHFDLKAIDPVRHQQLCGADNRAILRNARRMQLADVPVVFRTPIVPGLTDRESDLLGLADFLGELDVGSIHLLRYHRMGEVKLPRLDAALAPLGLTDEARGPAPFRRAAELLRSRGLEVST